MKSFNIFKNESIINKIKENLKNKYIKIDKKELKNFIPSEQIIQKYMDILKTIIKKYFKDEKEVKEKDLNKIIKLYLYILYNKKSYNAYKYSFFNDFKSNYEKVIEKSKYYFRIKQQNDVLNFMQRCYNRIIEIYNIVKLKMKDDNISQLEISKIKELKEEIKKSIENKFEKIINDLEQKYKEDKSSIYENIRNYKGDESSFNKLVNKNKDIFKLLIQYIKNKLNKFDYFLTERNQKIIDSLKLKELEEDKKAFEKNMLLFEKVNMEGISEKPNEFITQKKFFFYWKIFDKDKTLQKYKTSVDNFFNNKDNILSIIKNNKVKAIDNIEEIYNNFQNIIQGFQNHFGEFEKIVKEVEEFIYKEFGIKE